MIEIVQRYVIPAAYDVLPLAMRSPKATALLLAIGLQESLFVYRRQGNGGPARGWWMFEPNGVTGVLAHSWSAAPIRAALYRLGYPESPVDALAVQRALEHNDILAAVFARSLLWTLPSALPEPTDADAGWQMYAEAWRPGKARPATWGVNYSGAWNRVLDVREA